MTSNLSRQTRREVNRFTFKSAPCKLLILKDTKLADFRVALTELLGEEGGYVNNSHDAGGETVFGIARRFHPNWPGWSQVDVLKRQHSNLVALNEALASDSAIQDQVADFYRQTYWNFDALESQIVANKLLDIEVNFGIGSGTRILQEALSRIGFSVAVDGALGPHTLEALQKAKEPEVLHGLRAYSALYRVHRILKNPDQIVFAEGWLWRDTA